MNPSITWDYSLHRLPSRVRLASANLIGTIGNLPPEQYCGPSPFPMVPISWPEHLRKGSPQKVLKHFEKYLKDLSLSFRIDNRNRSYSGNVAPRVLGESRVGTVLRNRQIIAQHANVGHHNLLTDVIMKSREDAIGIDYGDGRFKRCL